MFVSIIVPVYNAEKMLPRSIESVLSQPDTDWELLLIDDGSTDNSARVCSDYARQDSRIRLIQDSNHGVSHARNTGIDNALGQYLYFMDADDWLAPNALGELKKQVNTASADVVFTAFYKEYKTKTEYISVHQGSGEPNPYHTRLLGTVWGKLYRRAFIGSQRFNEALHLCEDAEFNYRLLPQAKSILYCEYATYHYVYYGNSAVRGYQPERVAQYIQSLERIHAHAGQADIRMQASVTAFTCNVFSVIVMNNLFNRSNKAALSEKFRLLWSLTEQEPFRGALAAADPGSISKQQYILIRLCRAKFVPGIWLLSVLNALRNKLLNY